MELLHETSILALAVALVAIPYYTLKVIDHIRKPKLKFFCYGGGNLYRHFDFEHCRDWGVISVTGLLSVRHKPVTVVDARAFYYMEEDNLHGDLFCGEEFPPKMDFERVKDDGYPAIGEGDRGDMAVAVNPNGSEVRIRQAFMMAGNFATEYGPDLFDGTLCEDGLFATFYIQFRYQYNGDLYWSDEFPVAICPRSDMVFDREKPYYVNREGKPVNVITRTTWSAPVIIGDDD